MTIAPLPRLYAKRPTRREPAKRIRQSNSDWNLPHSLWDDHGLLEKSFYLSYVKSMKKASAIFDRSRIPMYVQVASVMRQRIENGHWVEGEKISTLEELETEFGVARVTIRQAIEMLRGEGLLDAQQGRGTFVSGKPKHNRWLNLANDFDVFVASIRDNTIKRVNIEQNVPPPDLGVDEGRPADAYTFLRSIQYNQGEPFSAVNLYLDQRIFDVDPKHFTSSAALPKIVDMAEIEIKHAFQTLTIGVADLETAEQLKIGLGEPTADCRLVLLDSAGVAVYVSDVHYKKDCFALRVDLLENKPERPRKARK